MFTLFSHISLAAPSWMIHEHLSQAPHAPGFAQRNPVPGPWDHTLPPFDVFATSGSPSPAPPPPIVFSAVLSDYAVLQYGATTTAVLYGQINQNITASSKVLLTFTDLGSGDAYTVAAVVNAVDGSWRAVLHPQSEYGGAYAASAVCTTCDNTTAAVITDLTYGDVWFCSGQSNMQLSVYHTFGRNWTKARVMLGDYDNIRLMLTPTIMMADADARNTSNPARYILPAFKSAAGGNYGGYGPHTWLHANVQLPDTDRVLQWEDVVDQFSATCWYTASRITDRLQHLKQKVNDTSAPVPLGLIESAVGGTTIQSWVVNGTLEKECTRNGTAPPGKGHTKPGDGSLWNGMVLPFLNMTIKGVLWYQGENNCFECNETTTPGGGMVENACGNPLAKSGYACYFKQMVETWRKAWSKDGTTGLTDEMFPIGVVTLASQEGQCGGGWMRIAQSGGTGLLPTADLPNTFVAQGWDAQEPSDPSGWPTHERTCACMGFDSPYSCGEPGPSTGFYMGPIHPRSKQIIGDRMAQAALHHAYKRNDVAWSGPILQGCQRDHTDNASITITFDLSGKAGTEDAMVLWQNQIQLDEVPLNPIGSRCKATLPNGTAHPLCSSFGPSDGSLEVEYTYALNTTHSAKVWVPVSFTQVNPKVKVPNASTGVIKTHINYNRHDPAQQVDGRYAPAGYATGIRYGFGQSCCMYFKRTKASCPVNSCPIRMYNSTLSAVPFIAKINANGTCHCTPPAKCDG